MFRSPYPEKKSVNESGVVGEGITANASFILAVMSAE
jgi:hypothetical protein